MCLCKKALRALKGVDINKSKSRHVRVRKKTVNRFELDGEEFMSDELSRKRMLTDDIDNIIDKVLDKIMKTFRVKGDKFMKRKRCRET